MAKDDYSAYPPHAKQLATELFNEGLNLTQVVEKMRETYPRISRITLNAWSINDEAFGVVYRNGIAGKAQSVVVESMEQLEDVYAKTEELLDDGNSESGIDTDKATVLRLMMDTARHKKTTALMLLGRINKNYSDKIQADLKAEVKASVDVDMKAVEGLSIEQLLKAESTITDIDNKQHHEG